MDLLQSKMGIGPIELEHYPEFVGGNLPNSKLLLNPSIAAKLQGERSLEIKAVSTKRAY